MFCKQCGKQLADDAQFCSGCGAQQQPAQPAQPVQQPQQPAQQPVYQQPVYQQPAAKKSVNGKMIAIIVGAVVIIAAIAVALVLILGGGSDSEPTEAGGTKDNLDLSSKGSANAMLGSLQNVVTSNGADFELYFYDGWDEYELSGSLLFDVKKEEIIFAASANSNSVERNVYIYDGYAILEEDGYYDVDEIADSGMSVDEIFDMLNEYDFANLSLSGDTLVDLVKENVSDSDLEMVEQFVDLDDLAGAVDDLLDSLNDDDWLEENLDEYSRTDKNGVTKISLEVSSFDFLGGIVDIFLPIFDFSALEEMTGESIDEDELRDMLDVMIEDELGSIDFFIALDITIEDDFVTDLVFDMDMDGDEIALELHLDNVGNPSIDEDELADILDEALGE